MRGVRVERPLALYGVRWAAASAIPGLAVPDKWPTASGMSVRAPQFPRITCQHHFGAACVMRRRVHTHAPESTDQFAPWHTRVARRGAARYLTTRAAKGEPQCRPGRCSLLP
eukprot:2604031-Alexandrium_andersonii.AAC.1